MASFNKFHQFVEDLAKGVHDLSSDTLKVYLSNTAPDSAADAIKSDLAEISAGNGYTAGGEIATITSCEQVAGLLTLIVEDIVWTAASGPIGPFRYAVMYNDTPTSPADPLIGWWDYGTSITLADGDTFTFDADPTDGVLQLQ